MANEQLNMTMTRTGHIMILGCSHKTVQLQDLLGKKGHMVSVAGNHAAYIEAIEAKPPYEITILTDSFDDALNSSLLTTIRMSCQPGNIICLCSGDSPETERLIRSSARFSMAAAKVSLQRLTGSSNRHWPHPDQEQATRGRHRQKCLSNDFLPPTIHFEQPQAPNTRRENWCSYNSGSLNGSTYGTDAPYPDRIACPAGAGGKKASQGNAGTRYRFNTDINRNGSESLPVPFHRTCFSRHSARSPDSFGETLNH